MANRVELASLEVRGRLHYDPRTGIFTWLPKPGDDRLTNSWNARYAGVRAGSIDPSVGYRIIEFSPRRYMASHLAWVYMTGSTAPRLIDHRNRNRADDRWENLRLATYEENACNRAGSHSHAAKKGAYSYPNMKGRWLSMITFNRATIRLGMFDSEAAAHAAYVAASKVVHGAFASAE